MVIQNTENLRLKKSKKEWELYQSMYFPIYVWEGEKTTEL